MSMPAVLTPKVLLFVNVIVGILEMDLIVLVSKSFIHVFKVLYLSTVALFCFASIRAVALQLVLFCGYCILSTCNQIICAVNSFRKFIKIKQL